MRLCKTEECVSCWRGSKNGHGENWFVMTPVCTSSDSGIQAADPVKCQSIMSPFKWIVFTLRSSSCFWRIVFSIPFKCAVVKEIHAASTDDWAQQPYLSVHAPLNQIIFHVMPCHPKQLDYNRPFKPPNCISIVRNWLDQHKILGPRHNWQWAEQSRQVCRFKLHTMMQCTGHSFIHSLNKNWNTIRIFCLWRENDINVKRNQQKWLGLGAVPQQYFNPKISIF